MSRHSLTTTYQGQPVTITMGWDRPLQGFFMTVLMTAKGQEDIVYSNLDDPALTSTGGFTETLDYFLEKLESLGLEATAEMVCQVELDGFLNEGNRTMQHTAENAKKAD